MTCRRTRSRSSTTGRARLTRPASRAGESVRERAGGEVSLALGSRIGILLNASSPLTAAETAMHSRAEWRRRSTAHGPTVRVLADGTDRTGVKAAIEQMRAQGVEIFLLGLGSLDPWCLAVMKDAGGCAVVADWASSGALPAQVFVSVEEDITAGVSRALERATRGGARREWTGARRSGKGAGRAGRGLVPARWVDVCMRCHDHARRYGASLCAQKDVGGARAARLRRAPGLGAANGKKI